MKKLSLLGGLTPARFMRDYWHKKPLLIRQAIPGFTPLLSREALFEMAGRDDVESRLISHFRNRWNLQAGPLHDLPPVTRANWTMLVQGANLHDRAVDALLQQFRFIPDARLDDLMISYATDGGGVGPHFDSYDVFLLQAHGKRHWKIGAQKDLSLVEGMPLKILQNFEPEQEFVLEPGDMLYLPPKYAHDGVAVGECMTYSIGFRSPSYQELGEAFLQFMAETIDLPGRYADPGLSATRHPAQIDQTMLTTVATQLRKIRFSDEDITVFLGEYLSEPKPSVFFSGPARKQTPASFRKAAIRRGIRLDSKTRMLYRGSKVFINGESFAVSRPDGALLKPLADQRWLDGAAISGASDDLAEALHAWHASGWLELK
jgi:50S ribosomal protein L16 3-hydroxylase